jgi:hypothetical protein
VQERRSNRLKAELLRREEKKENLDKAKRDLHQMQKLTTEVQHLWAELENTYSLSLVTELENDLA